MAPSSCGKHAGTHMVSGGKSGPGSHRVQHQKFSLFFCLALIILIYMVVGGGTYVSYNITPSLCT